MKKRSLLSALLIAICFLVCVAQANAQRQIQTAILKEGVGGSITVEENEALYVFTYSRTQDGGVLNRAELSWEGNNYIFEVLGETVRKVGDPAAFAGPITIIFHPEVSHMIVYQKVRNSGLRSMYFRAGESKTLEVPTGKVLRLTGVANLDPVPLPVRMSIHKDNATFQHDQLAVTGSMISGPASIEITSLQTATNRLVVFSYYLMEDFTAVPDAGAVSAPAGGHRITIERSTDLVTWTSAFETTASSDQRVFYRFKLSP